MTERFIINITMVPREEARKEARKRAALKMDLPADTPLRAIFAHENKLLCREIATKMGLLENATWRMIHDKIFAHEYDRIRRKFAAQLGLPADTAWDTLHNYHKKIFRSRLSLRMICQKINFE